MSHGDGVAVCIVTHNSAEDLPECLAAVAALEPRVEELVIVDCASGDGSAAVAEREAPEGIPLIVRRVDSNLGFAGGMNLALELSSAPWVLSLNADARPEPDYCRWLLEACGDSRHRIAAATGRLSRFAAPDAVPRLDACGMRLTLTWRHLDRQSGEIDRGQLSSPELVFGATGAATLFRREALDDVALDGEVLATEFHSFREDAELCFRLRERGWEIVYAPRARALHRRFNLPSTRREMPPAVNLHSLKNRYLLRAYHQTASNFLLTLGPTLWRDLLAVGHVLLRERSSLEAYRWLWRNRVFIRNRRRQIRERRSCSSSEINRWFFSQALSL